MTTRLASPPVSESTADSAPARRVMIVEDESVISLDIKNSLMRLGYDIAGVAASGESALSKIQSNRPDIILMDIHLKGEMTGIDVSEKVKSDFQIPIVYLTANADDSTFKEANQTDPYGYLLKPFEEKELGIAIEIALRKHEKEQVTRSSERWYATAFQSLSEAVVATDRHGDVIFMNALAESITSWSLSEALDRPIADVLTLQRKIQQFDTVDSPEGNSSILEMALGATLGGTDVVPLPHHSQLVTRSLQVLPVEGHAVAVRDTTGYVTGSLFTLRTAVEALPNTPPAASLKTLAKTSQAPQSKPSDNSASDEIESSARQREIGCVKTFVESFVREQPTYFASGDLVANHSKDAATLTSRTEGTVVTGKQVRNTLTAVVNRNSIYWEIICHSLIENSFFPVSQRTNGTCYFQHCTIPKNCQVYRTSASELWEVWHGKDCPKQGDDKAKGAQVSPKVSRNNLMVLRRGSWYHIQSLLLSNDTVKIQTIAGEIFTSSENLLVWGTQLWH